MKCEQYVEDGYSYMSLAETQNRNDYRQCKYEAKYKVTTENTRGYIHSMNVCTRHKNDLIKRFKILEVITL